MRRTVPRRLSVLAGLAFASLVAIPSDAQAQAPNKPRAGVNVPGANAPQNTDAADQPSPPSIQSSLGIYGDPGGARAWLLDHGIRYNAIYTSEVLSNVSGGIRRGSVYQGKLEINTTWDLEKLAGLQGLSFFANGFQIHPTAGISRRFVGNFQTISAIEALPATRLSELWIEKKFFDDKVGLRIGQLAADAEFFISSYSLPFLNSDWPAIAKQNMPGGGPAYPLSTPGIRLRFDPNENVSVLAAVFNGDPGGRGLREVEVRNRTGTLFPLTDPPLAIQEMQYRYNQGERDEGLAGILRLGAWQHFGRFRDQRFGDDGLSLADAASSGVSGRLRGNWGLYGVVDQQLYRPVGGDANSGITAFSRVSLSPSDRNLVQFYLDGGLLMKGMIPGRPHDIVGATFLYSQISKGGRDLDRDIALASGLPQPLRSSEITLEATYVAEIVPGWSIQPDLQYIIRPSGGASNPRDPLGRAIPNATVLGLRTTIVY